MTHELQRNLKQAILLVAGRGSRLAPLTDTTPKCLLEMNGQSLLIRLLRQLKDSGIEKAILVTGYLAEKIEAAVEGQPGIPELVFAKNETWDQFNNADSLRVGMQFADEESFLLCDGDLLICESQIIRDLICDKRENILGASLQLPRNLGEEEMKFQLEAIDVAWGARRVIGLSKGLEPRFSHGESMGMQVVGAKIFSKLKSTLENLNQADRENKYYEDIFARLIRSGDAKFFALAIQPEFWTEIDTLEDLEGARRMLTKFQSQAAI